MNKKTLFSSYIKELSSVALQGDAREESFYPVLADTLAKVAEATGRNDVHVTTLPKPTDAGNPDFRIWDGKVRIIGYIEAKKPTQERLEMIENSEQLQRYRSTFPNLILTNFLDFRLYKDGELIDTVLLARPFVLNQLRTTPPTEKVNELFTLFDRFLGFSIPRAFTAESLAIELAKRTRFLREVVAQQLYQEKEDPGTLAGFYEAFQTYLIGTLTPEDFANLFAQTITYGLFAARTRAGDDFSRQAAFDNIPHTIGVLRDLFRFISLGDLPEQLAWCVDDITEVLAVADVHGILDRYYHEGKGSDPVVHFYETFLAEYDPKERERRGVYYTPEPVVSYITRSLHELLKNKFNKADGFASDGMTLLDPAAGTMTFIARAVREAVEEFERKYGSGVREDFVRRHILNNFFAFELMMAPYAVGHLKMGFLLEELGHRLADSERMPFYLTNTLEMVDLEQSHLPGLSSLAEESHLAGKVKKETPILVILGNPPYSGHSANRSRDSKGKLTTIGKLIEDYKQVDGARLAEKNPKWLQDDYVKFLRFAQWKIEQTGCGVVGMITNHSYLDNPTFRGMRQSLMRTYDEIFILNLHGNSLKKETCPDGSKDENVFDIRQGVAIALFIRQAEQQNDNAVVRYADLWGIRDTKYSWLNAHDHENTDWQELQPTSPNYFFVPRDIRLESEYLRFPSVTEIFPVNSVGIVTARDSLTIHWSPDEAWTTVTVFSNMEPELAREGYKLGKDTRDWRVTLAQKDLRDSGPTREKVVPILYRPFDIRYTYYTGRSRGYICMPRPEVMQHMLMGDNIALIAPRQHKDEFGALVTLAIGGHKSVAAYDINFYFPLYLYPPLNIEGNMSHLELFERQPNINPKMFAKLEAEYGLELAPEEILFYVYAVLYAPIYRERYAELLRMDFPRIPFTADLNLFKELGILGSRLATIHLLKSPELDPPACRFEGEGDGRIMKGKDSGLRYIADKEHIYINTTQYFEPVPQEVWEYRIGGYQICEKWLKDRIDCQLGMVDIRNYCRIVTAIGLTMDIQENIDTLYPQLARNTISW